METFYQSSIVRVKFLNLRKENQNLAYCMKIQKKNTQYLVFFSICFIYTIWIYCKNMSLFTQILWHSKSYSLYFSGEKSKEFLPCK